MARPRFHDPVAFLSALPHWCQHRAVVLAAAAPAQRLMDWHDERPEPEQRPYSATWRPVLAAIWSYAAGDTSRGTTGAPADLIAAIRSMGS